MKSSIFVRSSWWGFYLLGHCAELKDYECESTPAESPIRQLVCLCVRLWQAASCNAKRTGRFGVGLFSISDTLELWRFQAGRAQ